MNKTLLSLLAVAPLALASPAAAQAPLIAGFGGPEDFGSSCLHPNDDGSSSRIDLRPAFPQGLDFFGATYESFFVNTNGNITFAGALSQFTPDGFPIASQPMIAPYWGDVDIRGGRSGSGCEGPSQNGVWWHLEEGRAVVTWDEVGVYSINDSIKMSFQLILTEARYCGSPGDFDVEFRYNRCEWEAGTASGERDRDGICSPSETSCTPAQVGFDAGNLRDFVSVRNSMMTGIHTQMCEESNIGRPGVWRFQIRSGQVQCPDAGEACETGQPGICGEGRTQCVGSSVECQSELVAGDELCNEADDDCDGETDEGDDICPALEICDRGRCIPRCFEGGCDEGEVCTEQGACAEVSCQDVTCGFGTRCVGGQCVDLCGGVVCPGGQVCQLGQCQDECAGVSCDGCNVCEEGVCLLHCVVTGCPAGEACEEDGHCVPDQCLGVRCGPGRVCVEGSCLDACSNVMCPLGEVCNLGECIAPSLIDAGPPPDAGPLPDAGPFDAGVEMPPEDDAGDSSREVDAGHIIGTRTECICRAAGAGEDRPLGLFALFGALGLALAWRRRR